MTFCRWSRTLRVLIARFRLARMLVCLAAVCGCFSVSNAGTSQQSATALVIEFAQGPVEVDAATAAGTTAKSDTKSHLPATPSEAGLNPLSADVVIYGATPSGIMAAIEAARLGKQVILLEPTRNVGGMMTNGLDANDMYTLTAIGGLAVEFYQNVNAIYKGNKACNHGQRYEPHVALQAFNSMLAQYSNILVFMGEPLASVQTTGTTIQNLITTSGHIFQGTEYIDASYTGDLMAAANVSYTVGRESSSQYNERVAGVGVIQNLGAGKIDPYVVPKNPASGLIAHVSPPIFGGYGTADSTMMAYNYRDRKSV